MGDHMLIKEYRVVLPMTVEEYRIGHLYSVAEASKHETGGGEGVEVVTNEPFNVPQFHDKKYAKSQYTHKIYHLERKLPRVIRMLAPIYSLKFHERSWNAWPYCKTQISNDYMGDSFLLEIDTVYLPDRGKTDNAHRLTREERKIREVIHIDIANNAVVPSSDYDADEDPSEFRSVKTGRGPLRGPWTKTVKPVMCAYKLMRLKCLWRGMQKTCDIIENIILKGEQRLLTNFHRQAFCWIDKWYGLTMEDVRAMEDRVKQELDELRKQGRVRGMLEK